MFGVAGDTLDAMMRASTRRAIASADVVIDVPLEKYGSLDWRRAAALIDEGYRAAEAMRDRLLPFAVSEAEFEAWRRARQARRLKELPYAGLHRGRRLRQRATPSAWMRSWPGTSACRLDMNGARSGRRHRGRAGPLRDGDLAHGPRRRARLRIAGARPRQAYAPPFMMLGMNLENTTSSDFRITATARYLAFDTVGSGSELAHRRHRWARTRRWRRSCIGRLARRRCLWRRTLASASRTFNVIKDDSVIARYRQTVSRVGLNVGVNLGAQSDVRVGAYVGRTTSSIEVGDPGFPELPGKETGAEIGWRMDTQDSPVVPSRGVRSEVRLSRIFDGPDIAVNGRPCDFDSSLTQLSAYGESILERRSAQSRVPVRRLRDVLRRRAAADRPVRARHAVQARRLRRGRDHRTNYYVATGGYLRQVGRLPDFMGGRSSREAGSKTATRSTNGRSRPGARTAASAS